MKGIISNKVWLVTIECHGWNPTSIPLDFTDAHSTGFYNAKERGLSWDSFGLMFSVFGV
jgi:hypothetical protein